MPFPIRRSSASTICLAWLLASFANHSVSGQENPAAPTLESRLAKPILENNQPPQTQKHWLENLAGDFTGHQPDYYARNHVTVLDAFRSSVAGPSRSAVRIWCDGRQTALGTIITSDGFVATKASELAGAVECELHDGTRYKPQLVGSDRGSDLAVLKIDAHHLPAIPWSEQAPPAVGGWVITPGLSDVPQSIGIVSVAAHPVRGGVLGIQMTEDEPGPRITYVVPGSGAADAGLARGDIITHVNGQPLQTSDQMVATTSGLLPGETIRLSIQRVTQHLQIVATLGSVANTLASPRARFQDHLGGALSKRRVLFPAALEHDSNLAPQHCGGALVNLDGKALGINIARASRISSYAIPAHVAQPILKSIMARASQSASESVTGKSVTGQGIENDLTEVAIER